MKVLSRVFLRLKNKGFKWVVARKNMIRHKKDTNSMHFNVILQGVSKKRRRFLIPGGSRDFGRPRVLRKRLKDGHRPRMIQNESVKKGRELHG